MVKNVKNTISKYINNTLTPLPCCSCGELGELLCDNCIYNITSERESVCIECLQPSVDFSVCCQGMYIDSAYVGGRYEGVLKAVIKETKFDSYRYGACIQAQILSRCIPASSLPAVVVPVPTSSRRIRQRGFDHTRAIAIKLAQLRGFQLGVTYVERSGHTLQHGSTRAERFDQAERTYTVREELSDSTLYIIVDDVYTTGATVRTIARKMREKGAKHIWLAITARHTLDK